MVRASDLHRKTVRKNEFWGETETPHFICISAFMEAFLLKKNTANEFNETGCDQVVVR